MMNKIIIHQRRVVNAKLADDMDFNDWAILGYIEFIEQYGNADILNGSVQLKYKKLLKDMPLLPFNTKSSISRRLKKLYRLELIKYFLSEDGNLFVKTTDYYNSVVNL